MLIIYDIKTQPLHGQESSQSRDYEQLLLTDETLYPRALISAILTAYDLGDLNSITRHSNPHHLSATFNNEGSIYRLNAKVKLDNV